MAGIAGWIDWERDVSREPGRVAAMGAALAHRGRERSGMWLQPPAAFACRYGLLDAGGQPVAAGGGGEALVLMIDGLPTNMAALRRELGTDAGSAAALLLEAYRRWGEALPERLDGAFALAVWDGVHERLLLARDRLGVRPLFFAVRGQGLLFASELKGLLAHPAVPPELDADGLAELLALSPNRTPGHGVFRGVREVLPGGIVRWDRGGLRERRYWQLAARPHRDTPAETVATVRELFAAAVKAQVDAVHLAAGSSAAGDRSAVGAMLSGGLDSTAVVALMREGERPGAAPLPTFSVEHSGNEAHFQPDGFQPDADGPWVARAAAHYGTHHQTVTLDPSQLVAALRAAMQARDLPGMADVDAALYLFCQAIRETVPAVLSGEGADELFGGYPWFFRSGPASHFPWLTQLELRWGLLHPDVRRQCRPEQRLVARYEAQVAAVPQLDAGDVDDEEARQRALTFHNLTAWGPVLIERSDRMGQRAGVHVLLPFCDHHLVEYVFNVPWSLKAAAGERKSLLREAVRDLLPPDLLQRPKSPFPKTHNPAYLGAVQRLLLERLSDPRCRLPDIFEAGTLRALATDSAELDVPWFGQLMRLPQLLAWLLQFDAWLEGYRVTLI